MKVVLQARRSAAMDLTASWAACVREISGDTEKQATAHGATGAETQYRLLLPRSRAGDPFTLQATSVLKGIQRTEELLKHNRTAYIDALRSVSTKASDMTDPDRDQFDQVLTSFIVNCGSQIQVMQCALSEGLAADREEGQGAKLAHQKAVVTYLSERLQDLNQTFVDMKSEKKKAGMFRMLQSTAPSKGGKETPTNTPLNRVKQEAAAEEAASKACEALSKDKLQKLQLENKQLEAQFQDELNELRQVETRMVELSQLLGLFTGKLQDQQEDVVEIHEAAIGTTINVQKGNEELLKTIEINRRTSRSFVIAVVVLSLILLVLDQIIP